MNNDVPKERRIVIKQAVLDALSRLPQVSLPIEIKKIIKSYDNCRLIPYSRLMKDRGLSYKEALGFTGTEHACTDYYVDSERYVIYYNDCDKLIMTSNRYRWSIAHELGHVLLRHHINSCKARLFRNQLSSAEYLDLEEEADVFAAYILCPHAIMCFFRIKGEGDISALCKVSGAASWHRYKDFKRWRREIKTHFSCKYDEQVCWLYTKNKTCKVCKNEIDIFEYRYCPICGSGNFTFKRKEKIKAVIYKGIDLDEQGRALICPHCQNEQPYEMGNYCIICGSMIRNVCLGEWLQDNYDGPYRKGSCEESQKQRLPGNARYCPFCGEDSSFSVHLMKWEAEKTAQEKKQDEIDDLDFLFDDPPPPF